jgi:hypothetical protein
MACILKTNRHIYSILKFLVENVTTGLPVGDSFTGQIGKIVAIYVAF